MKGLLPIWRNIRAQVNGFLLRTLNPMAPNLPKLLIDKNEFERGPF